MNKRIIIATVLLGALSQAADTNTTIPEGNTTVVATTQSQTDEYKFSRSENSKELDALSMKRDAQEKRLRESIEKVSRERDVVDGITPQPKK